MPFAFLKGKALVKLADIFKTLTTKPPGGYKRLRSRFKFTRLFAEDPGVIGTCWFAQERDDPFHIFANVLRILAEIVLAPFFASVPIIVVENAEKLVNIHWGVEQAAMPEAILFRAPGDGGVGQYEITHLQPTWMLKVNIQEKDAQVYQVAWVGPLRDLHTYTAISYDFESAKNYYIAKHGPLPAQSSPQPPKSSDTASIRTYSPEYRRQIVTPLLFKYIDLRRKQGGDGRTVYIWMDEFCLSDPALDHGANLDREIYENREKERGKELGRLADIFRGASAVCVFCNKTNCDHTGLDCPWGNRLFTLAEILHAETVWRIMRVDNGDYQFLEVKGRVFREKMQTNAAMGRKWHLYAIMQHASNSGTVPWQVAIHALLVEAILRDEAGGFQNHKYLGRALNGLLPRRARTIDLLGNDGWDDLSWLLELNQGFYNATGLAAVCSLPDEGNGGHGWLGRPIAPSEGRERLEPLIVSFPTPSELTILSPITIRLHQTVKRDANALYTHGDLVGLKLITRSLLAVILVVAFFLIVLKPLKYKIWLPILWGGCALVNCVKLAMGTLYIERSGWLLYRHSENNEPVEIWLRKRDATVPDLTLWSDLKQLTPKWRETPLKTVTVSIVDLKNNTLITSDVLDGPKPNIKANALVPLAVHGCGITCMILHRPDNPRDVAYRVGMVSAPPYVLAHGRKTGSIRIGAVPNDRIEMETRTKERIAGPSMVHSPHSFGDSSK